MSMEDAAAEARAAQEAEWLSRVMHRLPGGRTIDLSDAVGATTECFERELDSWDGDLIRAAQESAHAVVPVLRRLILQDLRAAAEAEYARLKDSPGGWDIAKYASIWIQREIDQSALDGGRGR